jgi:hypothetical protein
MSPTSYQLLHPALFFLLTRTDVRQLADMIRTRYQLLHPALYFKLFALFLILVCKDIIRFITFKK